MAIPPRPNVAPKLAFLDLPRRSPSPHDPIPNFNPLQRSAPSFSFSTSTPTAVSDQPFNATRITTHTTKTKTVYRSKPKPIATSYPEMTTALTPAALTALRDRVNNTTTRARLFQTLNPSPEVTFVGNRASAACTYMAKLEVAEAVIGARIVPHVERVVCELEAWLAHRGF